MMLILLHMVLKVLTYQTNYVTGLYVSRWGQVAQSSN